MHLRDLSVCNTNGFLSHIFLSRNLAADIMSWNVISAPDEEATCDWVVFQLGLKHDKSGVHYILYFLSWGFFSFVHEHGSMRTQLRLAKYKPCTLAI